MATPQANRMESQQFDRLNGTVAPSERKRLIASIRSKDAALAQDLAGLLEAVDFGDMYKGIAEFYGCSTSTLIDALAGFILVLWVASRRAADPSIEQAEAVRRQVRGTLVGRLANLDTQSAQDAHTALIAAFVVTYQVLQATRASGDPRAFHELGEAACLFKSRR